MWKPLEVAQESKRWFNVSPTPTEVSGCNLQNRARNSARTLVKTSSTLLTPRTYLPARLRPKLKNLKLRLVRKFSLFLGSAVALKNFSNTNYVGEIAIGTPP